MSRCHARFRMRFLMRYFTFLLDVVPGFDLVTQMYSFGWGWFIFF